mgnify:CR=1 FL=1
MNENILSKAYNTVCFDREIVFKFFITFSLFEYALKKAGFRRTPRKEDVEVDWTKFSQTINDTFVRMLSSQPDSELNKAVQFILDNPPGKQVYKQQDLQFERRKRPDNISDTEWLSILIRGIRNNLFHGAKFRYDSHRDSPLMEAALIILEAWACCNEEVRQNLIDVC